MSKTIQLIITLSLSIAVLVACNTAEESTTTTESEKETVTATTDSKEVNESVDTEETKAEDTQKEEDTTEETQSTLTFYSKGESKTEELTEISGERYTLQAIPGFSLTPEEPGKDMLIYDQDDTVSMRIEALTTSATTFDDLVANTEQTMAAISEDYKPYDISAFVEDQNLSNSAAYVANFDTEEVITVVFLKADKLVRLTIYDNTEVDLSEAMIKMGLTIK
ncbi:hypothetical protein M3649_00355 [Ureibacillus chungkukjangi]|uniref:hypothetical protein n=1 Tax=Ureibacillus chungkukjangi TaxID=1202712 RepID=UPI00203E5C0D|nr:hypothetical protein [Ureibacillus chungkukjangi]MCM3386574.1 hypothetical protein [Ureibacillus chungkukjangi]